MKSCCINRVLSRYGDIHPVNQIERLFGIITMIIGGVVFGALVAKVTSIIDKRNPQQQAFNAKMKQLKMFLVDTGLPVSIRNRAKVSGIVLLCFYL